MRKNGLLTKLRLIITKCSKLFLEVTKQENVGDWLWRTYSFDKMEQASDTQAR